MSKRGKKAKADMGFIVERGEERRVEVLADKCHTSPQTSMEWNTQYIKRGRRKVKRAIKESNEAKKYTLIFSSNLFILYKLNMSVA